jgi:hypothetical protein
LGGESTPLTWVVALVLWRRMRARLTMPGEAPRVSRQAYRNSLSMVSNALEMSR